jgi:uncharacterized protein (DUF1015 family)
MPSATVIIRRVDTAVPFRAWRYSPAAGDPVRLVAPPYDVIGPGLQSRLYARSRYNVVRVDLGMTTPSDTGCDNRYTRAAVQLEAWKDSGVLIRDSVPTLTFVKEEFSGPDGRARVRHGFLAVVRLHDFSEGIVYPHEQTFSGPKQDRFELMEATAMGLSPVFLLYDLPADEIISAWSAGLGDRPPATVLAGEEGDVTRLWPTSDPGLLATVELALGAGRFIIADGHHRYETALRYRDHRRELERRPADATGEQQADGMPRAYEYVLAYLCNTADPGLAIYPTHRLVAGVDPQRLATMARYAAGAFTVEPLRPVGAGVAGVRRVVARYLADNPSGAFAVRVPAGDQLYGLRLVDRSAAAAAAPGHTTACQGLDVTILQKLILEPILGISSEGPAAEDHVSYFKDAEEALERLENGEFQAGFFMNPTRLEQVREVAFAGERMPQKATFFYPKLPTGLVFQDLTGLL